MMRGRFAARVFAGAAAAAIVTSGVMARAGANVEPAADAPKADPAAPAETKPEAPATTTNAPVAPVRAPTLDELLGLTPAPGTSPSGGGGSSSGAPGGMAGGAAGGGGAKVGEAAPMPGAVREELERRLSEPEVDDQFAEAVALMRSASRRLGEAGDGGLETQRVQEDVLRKLDALISQMRRQQQSQPKPRPQQGQQDEPQSQPRQSSAQAEQSREQRGGDPERAQGLPGARGGALRPGLETAKAAWGALPARVREMLMQGTGEKFSTPYERLTEDYYRKLAEEQP